MSKKFMSFIFTLMLVLSCSGCATVKAVINSETEPIYFESTPTIPEETQPIETTVETEPPFKDMVYFDENITFEYSMVEPENMMRYIEFIPSNVEEYEKVPLIIWLHGNGEKNAKAEKFFNTSFVKLMCNWELEGFNAYVICPQLYGDYHSKFWSTEEATQNVKTVIDDFVAHHNVDTDKIVIVGHSLGAQGCQYMAHELPEYFSAQVVLSAYPAYIDMKEVTIPTIAYIGQEHYGETEGSIDYTYGYFKSIYGEDSIIEIPCSHGELPEYAFNRDQDKNNRSDLMEWIFEHIN